jgi:hypothetical protein
MITPRACHETSGRVKPQTSTIRACRANSKIGSALRQYSHTVSIDMEICVKLCVLCIDIELFNRFMGISYWSKAIFNLITIICVTELPRLPSEFCFRDK